MPPSEQRKAVLGRLARVLGIAVRAGAWRGAEFMASVVCVGRPAKLESGHLSNPGGVHLSGSKPCYLVVIDDNQHIVKPATEIAPRHVPTACAALGYGSE